MCHWLDAKVFETLMHDLRELLPLAEQRAAQPGAVIMDGRTLHSTLKSAHAPALVATSRVIRRAPWCDTDDTEMSPSVLSMLLETGRIDQDVLATRFAQRHRYDRACGPAMHRALVRIRAGDAGSRSLISLRWSGLLWQRCRHAGSADRSLLRG